MATRHINLKNQPPIEVEENSTATGVMKRASEWADVKPFLDAFTAEGALNEFWFDLDGTEINHYYSYVFEGLSITPDGDGYLLTATTRAKTEMELVKEQMELQSEAIDYLIMGGGE